MTRAALLLVLAATLPVAGCTGGDSEAERPAGLPPSFSGVQHPLPTGAALANDPQLYHTVRLTSCGPAADGWQAQGTARNTTGQSVDYSILVFFTDAQARTVDSATATLEVPPGATGDWTAARTFSARPGTKCVVRAVTNAS